MGWFVLSLVLVAGVQAAPPPSDPVLLELEGKVQISRAGSQLWDPAHTNQVLRGNDRVRTGPRSRALVRLSDRTQTRIGADSVFTVPDERGGRFKLLKGLFYFLHRDEPGEMPVETPTAYAVVVGTEFTVEVAENGTTTLRLIDGAVDLGNSLGQLPLRNGEAGRVEPGQPPVRTAAITAVNAVQWCLYYPGVLYLDDLTLEAAEQTALSESLTAYRAGDLLTALAKYPADRRPASVRETIYLAALVLAAGQVGEAERLLGNGHGVAPGIAPPHPGPLPPSRGGEGGGPARVADALRRLIATVKGESHGATTGRTGTEHGEVAPPHPGPLPPSRGGEGDDHAPTVEHPSLVLATEWLVESYVRQAGRRLDEALAAAERAVQIAPGFAFGWARVAELEFSFGRIRAARVAVDKALTLAPRHAQAVALQGFLLAAANQTGEAIQRFDQAIALDGALGNAWLGRGLCRIRQGDTEGGRADLQTAATVEPQRAVLRSYLGKAFNEVDDVRRARRELELARDLDADDPTAWLYAALMNWQDNRINEAIRDLEHSQELNNNRAIYRSQLLVDQDRAVRGANLANLYQDANLPEVAVREAVRAVNTDYANFSAHLFLANSYDALRDPNQVNQRYETPWLNEYLIANLLAPVGAGTLSPAVSQQEYSRLFERNRLGLVSRTEYLSNGDWTQSGAQFGVLDHFSYALEGSYRSRNGQQPNNDLEQLSLSLQVKEELTPADSVFLQVIAYEADGGDLAQRYDPGQANRALRVEESQEPIILAGYRHEWRPGSHTLFLAGRLQDTLSAHNAQRGTLFFGRDTNGVITEVNQTTTNQRYETDLTIYTAELQQIQQHGSHTWIVGARGQGGTYDSRNQESGTFPFVSTQPQGGEADFARANAYGYWQWQALDCLGFVSGLSYDWLQYPENYLFAPLSEPREKTSDQLSPKGGIIWTPLKGSTLRAGYAQSQGGVSIDQSFQLEPTQIAGFNQAWRSMIPESVGDVNSAAKFENWGVSLEQKAGHGTYLGASLQWLESDVNRAVGMYELVGFIDPLDPQTLRQTLDYRERTVAFTAHQLLSDEWSVGARYRVSQAELDTAFPAIPAGVNVTPGVNFRPKESLEAILQQVNLFVLYTHPSGYFGQVDALWSRQHNDGYAPALPGDDFWQLNAFVGCRLWRRRAEIRLGMLNLTDQDYRLNPLNLTAELPRERTFMASLRLSF